MRQKLTVFTWCALKAGNERIAIEDFKTGRRPILREKFGVRKELDLVRADSRRLLDEDGQPIEDEDGRIIRAEIGQ